ncbi:MAG: hypothetical protein ACLTDR_08780 [Adlercreutzia equolifaciens]
MHILVVRNNSNPQAVDASLLLTAYLTSQGIEALLVDSSSLGTDAGRREVRAQLPAAGAGRRARRRRHRAAYRTPAP